LALAPDSGESFLREVDENLRRDQARDFAKRYGGWLIAAAILFLMAIGGFIYWQERQKAKAAEETETLSKIFSDIGSGNVKTAPAKLDAMSDSPHPAVRASVLFTRAALAAQQNDFATAIAKYAQIAGDSKLPDAYRNLALIRQTALQFDTVKPEQVIARLQPLSKAGNPWFGSAGELTGMALIKQGKTAEAGRLFAAMAADKDVPAGIRIRAVQMASTLGVDATASVATIEQGR
jgi:hypothetical protein